MQYLGPRHVNRFLVRGGVHLQASAKITRKPPSRKRRRWSHHAAHFVARCVLHHYSYLVGRQFPPWLNTLGSVGFWYLVSGIWYIARAQSLIRLSMSIVLRARGAPVPLRAVLVIVLRFAVARLVVSLRQRTGHCRGGRTKFKSHFWELTREKRHELTTRQKPKASPKMA